MKKAFPILLLLISTLGIAQKNKTFELKQMHQPRYCLFYDNHTMTACPDVGENFDADAFTNRIKDCGVDMITFHARCNQGNAYYNTKIGTMHPSLKYDLFGKLTQSCLEKDIAVVAYFNGGISSAEGLEHRDWITLNFDGRDYREPRFTPFVRTMCYNSPYRDHLIAMVKEVANNYPVSGFFIDCLDANPCICPICVGLMKQQGIDWSDKKAVTDFAEASAIRLAQDITNEVRAINPNYLLYFNGIGFEQQEGLCTHLECECLPNGFWGYEYLPVLSHYMRTLNKTVLNMTARFYDWGDFGSLRPEAAIEYDLVYGMANGMRPNVGGHFHPRGDLETAVLDRLQKVYNKLQQYDPWFNGAENITEIAIVFPGENSNLRNQARHSGQLNAAVRMLSELKQQFDVVTEASDWSKYKILVIPDDVTFNPEVKRRVQKHIDEGKAVISSGISGLDQTGEKFALEKQWGVQYIGENSYNPAYYSVGDNFKKGMTDMPLSWYSSGIDMKALPGTSIEAYLVKPYYNQGWDGEYAFYYTPPDKITDKPTLTIHDQVAHFSHRIFAGYYSQAPVDLRVWFANVLDNFLPEPLVKTTDMPSFAKIFVSQQQGRKIVHLLSYIPELKGEKNQMVEEPIVLYNSKIALRMDGKTPKKVYIAPQKTELPFTVEDEYVKIELPVSSGYSMVVFEE